MPANGGGRWRGGGGGGAGGGGGMFPSFGGFGGNNMMVMAVPLMGRMDGPMREQMRPMPPLPKADIVVAPKDLAPVQQTRKLFPETWLWKSQIVPSGGVVNFDETVPDTVTSWVATAFAVHPQTGLGISEQSAQSGLGIMEQSALTGLGISEQFPQTGMDISEQSAQVSPCKYSVRRAPTDQDGYLGVVCADRARYLEAVCAGESIINTAFAVHPQSGLGISEQFAQLQVSLPFFVSVNLPYSVIRGEKIILQVNIHNYSPLQQTSYVTLERSKEFDNLVVSGTSQTTVSQDQNRVITAKPNEVAALYFPIIPTKLGLIDISVRAQTTMMAEHVVKKLFVEVEGSPREYNVPFVLDLKTEGTQTKKINVEYPLRTVPGSGRVKVTAVGDLMGPSINGLDKLIRLPTGCGEQNMLKFAPNIFIVKYLQATNNLDTAVMNKAKEFMEQGYQRELTYRHSDGSFSAFGESDKSGSSWLTAFVVKSFVQAKPYIFIDDAVISKSVTWLVAQQRPDGSFAEPGRVINNDMQGGSAGCDVTLTAYVVTAMLEARSVQQVVDVISAAKDKALAYLEGKADALTDTYEQAQVLYALQLAARPKADQLLTKLESKAIVDAGTKHWERVITTTTGSEKPWEDRKGAAVDIELTSYVLLSLTIKTDRQNGLPVLKWITAQRNAEGGFSSTQDTVVALQALAEMAALVFSDSFNLNINIAGTGVSETLSITTLNARVLQTRELPKDVGEMTITASGQGMALVQVEVSYNIDDDDQKQSFELIVSLPRETLNEFEIRACAKWLENGTSSMAVMEVGTPSGFYPVVVNVVSVPVHKRLELESRKVVLYFDEISLQDTCSTLTFHRSGMVAGVQPVPVRIFDYYNPAKQVTEFYVPAAIRGSEICDVCGAECDFCKA
ncbi:pregnancy zone protein-like [Dreissena polymorpha]|uniref:pregnancy zone protein-like n=1 Tax=Dreissena polymorpha TaxID=45954 RepID=UPI0022640B2C|nr:pregnancy zone protein-like [Dreissena polymorpha]